MTDDDAPSLTRDLWAICALCAGLLVSSVLFVGAAEIDLWVADMFYDRGEAIFPLAKHPVPRFFNSFIEWTAIGLALFSIGGLIRVSITKLPFAGLTARSYTFLILCLVTGPGLIANALFKENWGRARPRQIMEFGGTLDFSPAMVMSDQCPGNCSFVSGDASMGFAVLAVALLAPPIQELGRKVWIILAVLFGAFIGGIRIVQGAHFLSDVIFAGLFVSLTIILLKMIVLDRRWGISSVAERGLGEFGVWAAPRLGLVHNEEESAWRDEQFARLKTGGWKRALWLFFRSGPRDFGLAEPQNDEGQPEGRPSEDGSDETVNHPYRPASE